MKDVTAHVTNWINCCKDVWGTWFANTENAVDEFIEVEEALFSTLVLSHLELTKRPPLNEAYNLLEGVYRQDMKAMRSLCVIQKAGNIYCKSKEIAYPKNMSLPIKSIDFMGTMLNGEQPYVELIVNDKEFILEPLSNLKIVVKASN